MDMSGFVPCDTASLIGRLREDGELLADRAEAAGLAAPVPTCPGWRVRDLLKHIGYVHRWAGAYVAEQRPRWVDRASEKELLEGGPGDESLPGWYREGHAGLVRTLEAADPGLNCWTFLDAPSPLVFWARRQAHETAIHRVDAAAAAQAVEGQAVEGLPAAGPDFPARFAVDGIDELIMGFVGRDAKRGSWRGPSGTIGIHAATGSGTSAHWHVAAGAGKVAVSRQPGPSECDVTGPPAALYLHLWNRAPAEGLEISGDADILGAFLEEISVTWR